MKSVKSPLKYCCRGIRDENVLVPFDFSGFGAFSQGVYANTRMMNAAQRASSVVDRRFIEKLTL